MRRMPLPSLLFLGATILGLLTSAQHFIVMQREADPSWRTVQHALNRELPFWYIWVLLSPVVVWAVRRVPLTRDRLMTAIPAHVAIGLGCILVHAALLLLWYRLTNWPVPAGPFWEV